MATHRDISKQALVLGTDIIELGGDGEAVRITFGDKATATRGVSRTIFNRIRQPEAILTIVQYPEDTGHKQLVQREALRGALPARVFDPGSAFNGVTLETVTWTDAECASEGDFVLSQETGTVTWTYALSGVRRVMP